MKTKLTKTTVEKAKAEGADAWIWDAELDGFGLRIQASGRKSYVIRYRAKDAKRTQRKLTIARASDMPPEKARELARKAFAQVAEGLDPAAGRKPAGGTNTKTVAAMFAAYVASMRDKGKQSADEVERALLKAKNCAAAALGCDRPAADVTPAEVVSYLSGFYDAGHRGAADKHRSYIASAYTWAIKSANDYTAKHRQDWGLGRNPAAEIARDHGATGTRDRNLSAAEIRDLWLATESDAGFSFETGACVRIMMACGQRVQETLRMEGSDIDLDAKLWIMPAHKTKGRKRPHAVPMPDIILPTLQALKAKHGDGPLFPGRTGSTEEIICHRSVNQTIGRWIEKAKAEAFQTRDLRRTWKSRAGELGISKEDRDLIQQHARHDTGSKHYDHADYLPQKRNAMAKWGEWLQTTIHGAQVVQFKAA